MAEDEKKTSVDEKENKEEKEEDPFADIFGDEEEETEEEELTDEEEETEEEDEEEKTSKKKKSPKKVVKSTPNVEKIVNDRFSVVEQRIERRSDVTDYLSSDSGKVFGKYASQIRKAALDPRFLGIPVEQIPQVILKPAAYAKVLDDARKAADEEAADAYVGGGSRRSQITPDELKNIDPLTMSNEEFQKLKMQAKSGKFKVKK